MRDGLPGHGAGLADNLAAGSLTNAAGAERLSAVLAICRGSYAGVIYAVHDLFLSGLFPSRALIAEPPECAEPDARRNVADAGLESRP